MYRRTHKRAHSHFSVFTIREEHSSGGEDHHYTTATTTSAAVTAAASKVRRAKSTELLAADPAQLEKQIEHELERKVHEVLRRRRRYSNVTVPTAVKFSISRGSPKQQPELAFAMARPRSPKKGVSNYQDLLDRTLASIRQQLSALSSERLEMQAQMEELTNGITEVRKQCSFRCVRTPSSSCLRRIRSHSEAKCHSISPRVVKRTVPPREDVDSPAQQGNSEDSTSTASSSPTVSPVLGVKGSSSSSHDVRLDESPASQSFSESVRSDSISSARSRGSSVHFRDASLTEVFFDEAIPELPESPRLDLMELPHSPNQRRRASSIYSFKAISTPDMARKPEFSSLPPTLNKLYFQSSLPDTVLNSTVPEEEETSLSFNESLSQSQGSSCADEGGSPRTGAIILRRSSLTGQLEHIRKPKKRIASFCSPPSKPHTSRYASAGNLTRKAPVVRVHPARSRKRSSAAIILPGIETTV